MDLVEHLNRKHQIWKLATYTNTSSVEVSEVSLDLDEDVQHVTTRKIVGVQLENFIDEPLIRTVKGKQQKTTIRIAWVDRDITASPTHDITEQSLRRIVTAFDLQTAFEHYSTAFAGVNAIPPSRDPARNESQSYAFCYQPKLALVWSSNQTTGRTQAVCIATKSTIAALKESLEINWRLTDQSMVVPLACAVILACEIDLIRNEIKGDVRSVEVRTGFHRWVSRNEQPAVGDLASLSAKMSGCATKLASISRKLEVVLDLLDFIFEQSQLSLSADKETNTETTAVENKDVLVGHIKLLQRRGKMQGIDIAFFKRRIEIQLTALFNLIAQNDMLLSHEVARDSKLVAVASQRDSSSMKTLAVVTMFFLPGTFVASIFSIPLFKWDAGQTGEQDKILNSRFGIYWAVTVPLTLVTFLIWASWALFQNHLRHKENDRAKFCTDRGLSEVRSLVARRTSTFATSKETP